MKRTLRLLTATLIVLGFVLFLACTPASAENVFASAKEKLAHQFRNGVRASGIGNGNGHSNGQISGNAKNIIFMVPE